MSKIIILFLITLLTVSLSRADDCNQTALDQARAEGLQAGIEQCQNDPASCGIEVNPMWNETTSIFSVGDALRNQEKDVNGLYLHYGEGAFEWVYWDFESLYKLEHGSDHEGYLRWTAVHTPQKPLFESIEVSQDGRSLTFGELVSQWESNVSNLGKQQNELGYYGDGVYFGDELIIGRWHFPSFGHIFEENGNMENFSFDVDFSVYRQYGISEDGMHIETDSTYWNTYELLGKEDGCMIVLMLGVERDNLVRRMCKQGEE